MSKNYCPVISVGEKGLYHGDFMFGGSSQNHIPSSIISHNQNAPRTPRERYRAIFRELEENLKIHFSPCHAKPEWLINSFAKLVK